MAVLLAITAWSMSFFGIVGVHRITGGAEHASGSHPYSARLQPHPLLQM
ncbi:MAG: hypothetical protein U9N48_07675 [Euryarchaeota archaeon]|nr:hypothetical protein [Euryarchaeota archaeon]